MAVAIEQFVQGLEQSGLITPSDLRAIRGKLPPDRQDNAQELAHELVRQKILTTYQVKEAYQGNAKNLVLGIYTILDQIGQGGMGQVFKAQHRKMKRLVAIKLLPAAMTKDQAAINRFQREVEAAAKLEHPNIVTAHDADESGGRHFLVMQYVEGTDLSALVKKDGPLPVADAINYVLQSARGLEFAHGEGVVHRDIKPANLLLDKKGVVKILDMGLARFESTAGAEYAELTGTGQIMGTVDYMSPEQALDTKHANERSDIYSLGCTLWYLVTGRAAFGGESVMAKLLAHREQPIPSLEAACPGATPALETLFTKMLAKKEEDRYQSMGAVVTDLERICSGQVAAAQPAARNTGAVGDDQAEDHLRSEFLGGTNPSKAASRRSTSKPAAVVEKRSSTPILDATITMAGPQIETDPKTEQSLVVPAARSTWWKNWRIPAGRRRLQMACATGAVALLLAGIVVFLKLKPETVQPLPRTAQGVRPRLLTAVAPFDAKQALAHQEAWAKHLGTEVEIENSLGIKLRLIPPGEFTMGSPKAEIDLLVQTTTNPEWQRWFRSEGPRHRVKLTQAFYLGSCEVTQRQYQEVMGVNPSHFSATAQGKDVMTDMDTGQHPVVTVNWFDAIDFCNKLSEKEQRSPYYVRYGEVVKIVGGTGYRLPMEAEWEYACRAGTTTRWSFGDTERDLGQHGWTPSDFNGRTQRVGELPANPFGLYDLYGNVHEWCWDWHGEYAAEAVSDPTGPAASSGRVLRGGAYGYSASFCRSASRHGSAPVGRLDDHGFRVARTIDAKSEGFPTAATGPSAAQPGETDPDAASVNPPLPAIAPFDAKQALAYQEAWAKHLGAKVEIENSLGMKLRLIPPGEFTMGSTPAEIEEALKFAGDDKHWQECIKSEAPQHKVVLTQPFYLGTREVTQAEYEKVMEKNPSHFAPMGTGKDAIAEKDTTAHPVEQVSWNDAAEFCAKLSEKEKLKPFYFRSGETVTMLAGTGYRLASEAEWEFACRAGTTTKYWIGDQDEDLPQAAWFSTNSGNRTHQVGELKVNPFGLYDIHGNVWEWVQDEWEPPYYRQFQDHPALNPSGPSPAGSRRVIRGGGWHADASRCRASSRRAVPLLLVGFRVSMAIEPQTPRGNAAKVSSSVSRDRPHIQTTTSDERAGKQADVPAPAIAPFDAKQALAHQEAWAWHLGTKVEIENSLGMKLRLIPPGEFMMGSPKEEIDELVQSTTEPEWQRWFRSEGPRHRAKLTQAFYLGSCEVTQRQYQEVMGVNPSHFSTAGQGKDVMKDLDTGQHPVESVSWFDAIDFCNKLSEQERRSPYYVRYGEVVKIVGGTGYRLPTEAEWECACRAGTTTRWSFGDTERDLGQHAWTPSNSNGRTQRVGELRANPFGLYDLYGNVFEWCWDWHGEYAATAVSDPTGATAGSGRVLRGGAFDSHLASHCRSASRRVYEPVSSFYVGFRVCCGR